MNKEDGRLCAMTPIIAIAAMIFITTFGQRGDPWYDWIAQWDTLITGIFAVVAAAWTVRQMSITDRHAERRHTELVGLQLRRDHRQLEDLNQAMQKLLSPIPEQQRSAIRVATAWVDGNFSINTNWAGYLSDLDELFECRNRNDTIDQALKHVPIELENALELLRDVAGELRMEIETAHVIMNKESAANLLEALKEFETREKAYTSQMKRLLQAYRDNSIF